MINLESHSQEINRLHTLANKMAIDAVEHARSAGLLLLEAKKEMKHGKFLLWVRDNAQVSLRQAQRYMAVAQGKTIPLRRLIEKSDTVSHLNPTSKPSTGLVVDGVWLPEPNCSYLFNDPTGAAYWVTHSPDGRIHVCKHYSGQRISSERFYWRYTIFADNTDTDLTSEFYIGTRFPILSRTGIAGVLESYGLTDIEGSLVFGYHDTNPEVRPFGEPKPENWYWDSELPDDGLFKLLVNQGFLNSNNALTYLG